MTGFLDNIELWLSGVGLLVILAVPSILLRETAPYWEVMALTATGVGIVHGTIFWLVRRRQRAIRRQAIVDIRGMLRDVVNNQLTVILAHLPDATVSSHEAPVENVRGAVERISTLLGSLSEESLRTWEARYPPSRNGLAGGEGGT